MVAFAVLGGTMAEYQLVSGREVGNSNRVSRKKRIKWDTDLGVIWSPNKTRNTLSKDNTITEIRRIIIFNVKLVQYIS